MGRYEIIGEVVGIYIKESKEIPRKPIKEGYFEKDLGLLGDIYSKGGNRQIAIFTEEGWEEILNLGMEGLCIGKFHENIKIRNLKFDNLDIGSIIKIGETIQEITEIGKKCFPECNIIKKSEACILSKKVIFTKVIKSGNITIGDKISYY